jgi:serine/threonine-protein kinase RsbW
LSDVAATLRIPADVHELSAVRGFIREHAAAAGADRTTTDDLVTAVDESVTNIILHGYQGEAGVVEIVVDASNDCLEVQLRDAAPPFDPTSIASPDTTLPPTRRAPGGMGIHLTRELADEVSYRRTSHGNELTLRKAKGGHTC